MSHSCPIWQESLHNSQSICKISQRKRSIFQYNWYFRNTYRIHNTTKYLPSAIHLLFTRHSLTAAAIDLPFKDFLIFLLMMALSCSRGQWLWEDWLPCTSLELRWAHHLFTGGKKNLTFKLCVTSLPFWHCIIVQNWYVNYLGNKSFWQA